MAWLWKCLVASLLLASCAFAQELKFAKKQIILAGKAISVEIADNEAKLQRGLMFRKNLPDNNGMLFIFPDEAPRSFWMKNTIIDLSIGFFDSQKKLVDMQEMTATSIMETNPPSYPSKSPARYALEMPRGWFIKNKIKLGDIFVMK